MVLPSFDFGNWGGTLVVLGAALAVFFYFALSTATAFVVAVFLLAVLVAVLYYLGVAIDNWLRHGGPL